MRITTDVLVIGGGMAGAWAAIGARRAGASVVLAEKGWCGTSGVTATAGPGHWWVHPLPRPRPSRAAGRGQAGWITQNGWRASSKRHGRICPRSPMSTTFPAMRTARPATGPCAGRTTCAPCAGGWRCWGVMLVDHAPARELLRHSDGSIGGARRRRRGEDWEVAADRATMSAEACCDLENWHRLTPPGDLAAVFEVEMDI